MPLNKTMDFGFVCKVALKIKYFYPEKMLLFSRSLKTTKPSLIYDF